MENCPGVTPAFKKDHTPYFRAGITINNKHISLGSFPTPDMACKAYKEAGDVYFSHTDIDAYDSDKYALSFTKFVILINLRDNGIYFKTPIYLYKKYFYYYFDKSYYLKFDADDLFYYSTHSIMRRGGHLFVADYGMQVNILSRYGIKDYAVQGKDYYFANKDPLDFRYGNIVIVNPYHGVQQFVKNGRNYYKARIHIHGDYVIGTYKTPEEAAIAYNKAAACLREKGVQKNFPENYPESLSAIAYASIYNSVRISDKIRNYKLP
ncbi:MAG: hypothetical protein ACI4EN_09895 [Butyrivibrio sp.]